MAGMRRVLEWVKAHPLVVGLAVLVIAVGVWTAVDVAANDSAQSAGYDACQEAIENRLGDADRTVLVSFEEEMPTGDLGYTAVTTDAEASWSCVVDGETGEPNVINGSDFFDGPDS